MPVTVEEFAAAARKEFGPEPPDPRWVALHALLLRLEWSGREMINLARGHVEACPVCQGGRPGHAAGCELAAAIYATAPAAGGPT